MATVRRQALSSLQPGAQNVLTIGIIIHSFNVKTIDSARTRFNNGERGVWTFTLRDSEDDFINVTVWGSVPFVQKYATYFHVGSVGLCTKSFKFWITEVEVINPKVVERRPEDRNELFVPSVSSSCRLTVNEGNALVQLHDAPTRERYEPLMMLPLKSLTSLRSLKSIFENLEALRDQYVDVLVVVTFVRVPLKSGESEKFKGDQIATHFYALSAISDIRNAITRDGRGIKFRNFEAADGSTHEVASLVLWENEWIERAILWEPKRTVLLLTDTRVVYDNFRKKTVLSIVRKTLITENPEVPQTTTIRNSVQCYDPDVISGSSYATPNPDTITTVMTIQDISMKLNKKPKQGERIQFATILKAYLMDINVDSLSAGIISTKCALCKKTVSDGQDSCMNLECPSGNGTRVPLNAMSLNLKVNLKDDTGYLIGCRLVGDVAERVLGCTAAEFQDMKLPQRTDFKWKYVLKKCDIRLHILGPASAFPNSIYNILWICEIEDEDDNEEDTQPVCDDTQPIGEGFEADVF